MDLTQARIALTSLAKRDGSSSRAKGAAIATELYAEIRECRIRGHSWKSIAVAISENCGVKLGKDALMSAFSRVDAWYERETGVPAIVTIASESRAKRDAPAKRRPGRPRKGEGKGEPSP